MRRCGRLKCGRFGRDSFKIAARVKVTFRKIRISLPETYAYVDIFVQLARSLGASGTGPP